MTEKFDTDDAAYLAWVRAHPGGYVINLECYFGPEHIVLHRPNCPSITELRPPASTGGLTERGYIKVCADTAVALSEWVMQTWSSERVVFKTLFARCKA